MPYSPKDAAGWTPDEKEKVLAQFPEYGAYIDNRELGPLLRDLFRGNIDDTEFTRQLYASDWYKGTSASAREWDALVAYDPAQARQELIETGQVVADLAYEMGATLDFPKTVWIAAAVKRLAWTEAHIRNFLVHFLPDDPGARRGDAAEQYRGLKEVASNYMIQLDDKAAWDYTKRIMAGDSDLGSYEQQAAKLAQTRYAGNQAIVDHIENGGTMASYLAAYRDDVAKELEIAPEQVDFNDRRFSDIVSFTDESGRTRTKTRAEAVAQVRGLNEWGRTRGAREKAAKMAEYLTQTFGKVAV